jgi:hypothetical protein
MEEIYTSEQSSQYANRFIRYINELKEFVNTFSMLPPGKGNAKKEYLNADEKHKRGLLNSYDLGELLLEVSFDHIFSFLRTITSPALAVAPWANARSSLESSGLSSWFTNNKVGSLERIMRGYAYRYDGVNEQIKIFRVMEDKNAIEDTIKIIEKLTYDAIEIGIEPLYDAKGK